MNSGVVRGSVKNALIAPANTKSGAFCRSISMISGNEHYGTTSLAIVVPTALASAQGHAAKNGIDWYFLLLLIPSFVAGTFVAAAYVGGFNAHLIVLVFILFTLYTAFRLWRGWRLKEPLLSPPRLVALTVRGVVGGALSALLGIGAAMVAVPYLERFIGLPRAIGTAAALALPMALAGTAAYVQPKTAILSTISAC